MLPDLDLEETVVRSRARLLYQLRPDLRGTGPHAGAARPNARGGAHPREPLQNGAGGCMPNVVPPA